MTKLDFAESISMNSITQPLATPHTQTVTDALFYQLMGVMGLKRLSWITRILHPILRPPAQSVAQMLVSFDYSIPQVGWNQAARQFLTHFITNYGVVGAESIPYEGPLMVVSNHPAALDVVILVASIQRDDLKFLHSDIPFVQLFPHIASHGIPVPYNIPDRLQTVRSTFQQLKTGGSVLVFPRGNVEPDPSVSPGSAESLAGWSSSLEMFLRREPETKTVVAICSGMLSSRWFRNPLVKRWKKFEQRQKVAEIFQIASQMVTGKKPAIRPEVRFSPAFTVQELGGSSSPEGTLLSSITATARRMLEEQFPA